MSVPRDECDKKLTEVNPNPADGRERFLEAYQQVPTVASAARRAGIHRSTPYRWMAADPEFVKAMRVAADVFFRQHRERGLAEEDERRKWRQDRELNRREMRIANLRRARAKKR